MGGPSKALADFVSEAQETVDGLSRDLLALDRGRGQEPDPDLVNRIFRAAHSLKGASAMFGVTRLAAFSHAIEDLLEAIRLGRAALNDAVLDALLESVEVLQRMVQEVGAGQEGDGPGGSLAHAAALTERIASAGAPAPQSMAGDPLDAVGVDARIRKVLTEYEEHRLRENARKGAQLLLVRAEFDLSDFDKRLGELNGALKPLGEIVATLPSSTPSAPSRIAFDLLFATVGQIEAVDRAVADLGAAVDSVPGTPARSRPPKPAPVVGEAPARAASSPQPKQERPADAEMSLRSATQTVRVDISRLDYLMNVVGELGLTRANVQRMSEGLRHVADLTSSRAALELATELAREGRSLDRRLGELQTGLLDVRMVPLGQVFDKLARLVRRVAREAGKEIDFRVSGAEVELDKLIVEELSDPLMHLVRNAIDHGVEPPDARAKAGKPRRGLISLAALQKGSHVVVEVTDDGAGIDEERVRQVAVRRGLVEPAEAVALSRRELWGFIFMPGFSTATEVSELSGRGVGLDVVKTNIASLSGIIDVFSEPGVGTTMSITLPVTLAIIRALLVGVSGRIYAVPLNSVLEIASVPERDVRKVSGREVIDLRGATLPVVRLARLFRHSVAVATGRPQVVVVGLAQERLGVAVDELLGQQDIVIKSLGSMMPPVRGIAGATDLGQRRTVLVLDVGDIIAESLYGPGEHKAVGHGGEAVRAVARRQVT